MAYEGELVKLENGRWARFQRCQVHGGGLSAERASILVAVELDDEQQSLRRAADGSLEDYWRLGGRGGNDDATLTTDEEHPRPTWPGDLGALH
jgi:hypothetical protein